MSRARPNCSTAAALSPPPTTVKARASATAWATVLVPASKRGSSNTPMGPFQKMVWASAMRSPNSAAVPGPMSRPIQPSGMVVCSWRTSPPASGLPISPPGPEGGDVGGQVDLAVGRSSSCPARVDHVGLEQRVADGVALGGEEREAHAAADDEAVDLGQQRLDDAELVGHLGPAEDGDERAAGVVAQAAEDLDLLGQQPPGRRREVLRRADDGGVRPVRRAERVVDVGVLALDQLLDEGVVVAGLARVEAQVLQQLDARRQLGQALADRVHRVLRVGRALGRPRWLHAVTVAPAAAATGWWAARRGCAGRRRSPGCRRRSPAAAR
jgi:hypothetical protein